MLIKAVGQILQCQRDVPFLSLEAMCGRLPRKYKSDSCQQRAENHMLTRFPLAEYQEDSVPSLIADLLQQSDAAQTASYRLVHDQYLKRPGGACVLSRGWGGTFVVVVESRNIIYIYVFLG